MIDTLTVELGGRSYPIYFSGNDTSLLNEFASRHKNNFSSHVLLADGGLSEYMPLQFGITDEFKKTITFKTLGEKLKSVGQLTEIYDALAKAKVDRSSALLAFGGGVIGDLVGFAAATYLRGIAFYQLPTTLLAMVDSSVGGKTGINIDAGKNLVGAFHQPEAVFVHTGFLKTLPPAEFSAGMAEVIKYGMLSSIELFEKLERLNVLTWKDPELQGIIRECCAIKAAIVRDDERELATQGGRALLNLGHTFAHAIENVSGYGAYLHGEAVAIGLLMASRLSERMGCISSKEVERVRGLLLRYSLPIKLRQPLEINKLLDAMKIDKKTRNGKLRFVTMQALGRAVTTDGVSVDLTKELWQEVGAI
jgi:3-dehydroquinate synthase